MKPFLGATLLAVLNLMQPAFAETDPSADASVMTKYAALASFATPVLISAAGTQLAVAGTGQVVKIVDGTGKGLSELTEASLDVLAGAATHAVEDASDVTVTVNTKKKAIPLVVRKDYLELNQKVAPQ